MRAPLQIFFLLPFSGSLSIKLTYSAGIWIGIQNQSCVLFQSSVVSLSDLWKVLIVDEVSDILREAEEVHERRDDGVDDGVVERQRHCRAHDAGEGRVVVGQF